MGTLPAAVIVLGEAGCARSTPVPAAAVEPAPAAVEPANFDALRRVAAEMPRVAVGRTGRDTLAAQTKSLSTEVRSLEARPLSPEERRALEPYREAVEAYQFAVDLMAERARRQASAAGGDRVPVQINTMKLDSFIAGAKQYGLPVSDETMRDGTPLKVLPSDAAERVWAIADAALAKATARSPAR